MRMRYIASLFLGICLSTSAFASSDVFLISRGFDDEFLGSHKVQQLPRTGYKELRLCNRSYWVRPYSVAWTKWEEHLGTKCAWRQTRATAGSCCATNQHQTEPDRRWHIRHA